ncbi:hypothetical protein C8Q76DRAFT_800974 [Earliella scabrosa]|nr:hypothetical protein C8Q76DRAFT_800974 [Earliella scabrosa]
MPLRRDYFRPGEAGARPVWRVNGARERKYPETLKSLCRHGSSNRLPSPPPVCPRCGRKTNFLAQLCFMEGVAGAYVFIGDRCKHRHWPIQEGPSEAQLEEIEAERHRLNGGRGKTARSDVVVRVVRKHASALVGASKTPAVKKRLRQSNNGRSLAKADPAEGDEDEDGTSDDVETVVHSDGCSGPSDVTVYFWYESWADPERRVCPVDGECDEHVLYIAQMSWIYVHARDFDYWSYDLAHWIRLDRPSEAIPVEKEGLPVLIRGRAVTCSGFAAVLRDIEREAGWQTGQPTLQERIGATLPSAIWTLLWNEDHANPEVFCLPLPASGLLSLTETEAFQRGLTGLEGARRIAYWDKECGEWQGIGIKHPLRVDRHSPVLLLRRQDAFYIRGLGDALVYLEQQRAAQQVDGPVRPTAAATQDEIVAYCDMTTELPLRQLRSHEAIEPPVAVPQEPLSGGGAWVDECLSRTRSRSPSIELVEDPGEVAVIHEKARRKRETRGSITHTRSRPGGVRM